MTMITPFSQIPVHKGQSAWAKEIRSVHKMKDQGTPLRSLADKNKVILHLCWKEVCHEKHWLLFFWRARLMWLFSCCGSSAVDYLREDGVPSYR